MASLKIGQLSLWEKVTQLSLSWRSEWWSSSDQCNTIRMVYSIFHDKQTSTSTKAGDNCFSISLLRCWISLDSQLTWQMYTLILLLCGLSNIPLQVVLPNNASPPTKLEWCIPLLVVRVRLELKFEGGHYVVYRYKVCGTEKNLLKWKSIFYVFLSPWCQ